MLTVLNFCYNALLWRILIQECWWNCGRRVPVFEYLPTFYFHCLKCFYCLTHVFCVRSIFMRRQSYSRIGKAHTTEVENIRCYRILSPIRTCSLRRFIVKVRLNPKPPDKRSRHYKGPCPFLGLNFIYIDINTYWNYENREDFFWNQLINGLLCLITFWNSPDLVLLSVPSFFKKN